MNRNKIQIFSLGFSLLVFLILPNSWACTLNNNFWNPSGFTNIKNWGAVGDGITNDTTAIQCALNAGGNLWVPSGVYIVSTNIAFPSNLGVRIKGQTDTASPPIIKGSVFGLTFGDTAYNSTRLNPITIEDMYFDGLAVKTYCTKCLVTFQRNVFSNSTGNGNYQAVVNYGNSNSLIQYNIFLQNPGTATAITLYKTKNLKVFQNIVGLNLNGFQWMLDSWPGIQVWNNATLDPNFSPNPLLYTVGEKLLGLKNTLNLGYSQGNFLAGLYTGGDTNLNIDSNIFNANPATPGTRDHASYLKGISGQYIRNWVGGWPNNEYGGIKARNLANLLIGANYGKDTPILLYVYSDTTYPQTLDNVDVCGNIITVNNPAAPPANHQGVWFMENVHPTSISNIQIYDNTIYDYSNQVGVIVTYQSPVTGLYQNELDAFKVYPTNIFANNYLSVPIWPTSKPYATGNPPVNRCAGLTPPSYNVQSY